MVVMHKLLPNNIDISAIAVDPAVIQWFESYFPVVQSAPKKNLSLRAANSTGKFCGSVKNFFSRTETKAGTLLAYWAADTIIAVFLLLTSTNPVAIILALGMLALHTYATFSVVTEIMQ